MDMDALKNAIGKRKGSSVDINVILGRPTETQRDLEKVTAESDLAPDVKGQGASNNVRMDDTLDGSDDPMKSIGARDLAKEQGNSDEDDALSAINDGSAFGVGGMMKRIVAMKKKK